jgi:hypothetical protein
MPFVARELTTWHLSALVDWLAKCTKAGLPDHLTKPHYSFINWSSYATLAAWF